jgi:hypothetical protein
VKFFGKQSISLYGMNKQTSELFLMTSCQTRQR